MFFFGFGLFWLDVGWFGLEYIGVFFLILELWCCFFFLLVFGLRKDREYGLCMFNLGEGRGGVVCIREGNGVYGMYVFVIGYLYLVG